MHTISGLKSSYLTIFEVKVFTIYYAYHPMYHRISFLNIFEKKIMVTKVNNLRTFQYGGHSSFAKKKKNLR